MSAFMKIDKDSYLDFLIQKAVSFEGLYCYQIGRTETEAGIGYMFDKSFDEESDNWVSQKIGIEDYEKIFENISTINFFKLMEENAGISGFDGATYTCKIMGAFSDSVLSVDVWNPFKNKDFPETTKFLNLFEEVEKLYNEKNS